MGHGLSKSLPGAVGGYLTGRLKKADIGIPRGKSWGWPSKSATRRVIMAMFLA
jgi:hypothetical protein